MVIGAGPVGLALAVDLAQRGVAVVVLDADDRPSDGSRAICWAKRSLEILDRLGVGEAVRDRGVTWRVGRQFHGDREVFAFDLLPEDGHKYPAFVNLPQWSVEGLLMERAQALGVDLRHLNRVTGHEDRGDHAALSVETPEGAYALEAEWVVACDGANSPTRARMGLPWAGRSFEERFLIVDVEMETSPFAGGAPERWFWFDPPFHDGKSALLHEQPNGIYRIDLQLPADADPAHETREAVVRPRIEAIVGDAAFRIDWVSLYRFRCIRLDRFVHGRVVFCGDSAHVVSPFGARGGNGGLHDADNLGWKLAAILSGEAPAALIGSYDEERGRGADENIANSARATAFMTPKSPVEALFRREALRLARTHDFARRLLNSGRLSTPVALEGGSLFTPPPGPAPVPPGTAAVDAPVGEGWLIDRLDGWTLLSFGADAEGAARIDDPVAVGRYGAGWIYLFRPDAHVCAAWPAPPAPEAVARARARALGR